jgi:ribokinase
MRGAPDSFRCLTRDQAEDGNERGAQPVELRALPVELVSTHGAGDMFVGTLAATLAAGATLGDSLTAANRAAAEQVSRKPD